MSSTILAFILLEEKSNEKIKRKILKNHSNPLDAPGESHVKFGLHLVVQTYIHAYFSDLYHIII